MAHHLGDDEDFWAEERSPSYQDMILSASAIPLTGRIYVMYHGTTATAANEILMNGFKQSVDGMLGRGVYVTRDFHKALRYPVGDKSQQVVLKLRVNVGKVIMIDRQNHPWQKTWHDYDYDTAWVPPNSEMVESGLEEHCVWDPKRIKVVSIEVGPPLVYIPFYMPNNY